MLNRIYDDNSFHLFLVDFLKNVATGKFLITYVSSSFVASSYAIPASSGNWGRTGKSGMLQYMGLQRVGHDRAELN